MSRQDLVEVVVFAGSMASALGVEPSGASGESVVERRSTTLSERVSITWTVLSLEQATNSRPSALSTMSFGLAPTAMVAITLLEAVSITLTDLLDQLETNSRDPSLVRTSW